MLFVVLMMSLSAAIAYAMRRPRAGQDVFLVVYKTKHHTDVYFAVDVHAANQRVVDLANENLGRWREYWPTRDPLVKSMQLAVENGDASTIIWEWIEFTAEAEHFTFLRYQWGSDEPFRGQWPS